MVSNLSTLPEEVFCGGWGVQDMAPKATSTRRSGDVVFIWSGLRKVAGAAAIKEGRFSSTLGG
jgi:hypothetical protein